MLGKAEVGYLSWVKSVLVREPEISLLESGLSFPLARLPVDLEAVIRAPLHLERDPEVCDLVGRRYGVPPGQVLPVLGTSLGITLACGATLGPGTVALVESPGYEPLWRAPELAGASVRFFPRRPEAGWRVEPEAVLSRWCSRTRLVIVSNLHNPTGRLAGEESLRELAEEVERRGAFLFVDEVYRDFSPGRPGTARLLGKRVVTASSLTKVYGLPGLRAGWVLGPEDLIDRMLSMINLLHVVDPTPGQAFVHAALRDADSIREEALARAREGWAVVDRWRRRHSHLQLVIPEGGICAWVMLPSGATGTDVSARLLEDYGVAVTPGRFFGDDRGVRIAFAGDPESLDTAMERLAVLLASHRL